MSADRVEIMPHLLTEYPRCMSSSSPTRIPRYPTIILYPTTTTAAPHFDLHPCTTMSRPTDQPASHPSNSTTSQPNACLASLQWRRMKGTNRWLCSEYERTNDDDGNVQHSFVRRYTHAQTPRISFFNVFVHSYVEMCVCAFEAVIFASFFLCFTFACQPALVVRAPARPSHPSIHLHKGGGVTASLMASEGEWFQRKH